MTATRRLLTLALLPLLALVLLYGIRGAQAAVDADLVTNLPGLNFTPPFKHYSGYLKASSTKNFHYWLTLSYYNATTDPIILWLNGGPGCSSLGGLIEELGPFHVTNGVVWENKWAWNRVGSVLFLESPAGVGFSYDSTGNVATNDDQVATDNYNALIDFFKKYPEFKNNDFYITGESYAGIYLPTLGAKIVADPTNFPNFKGAAIGNGLLNLANNYNTMVPLFYYHAIVREELYRDFRTSCCAGNIETCDVYSLFDTQSTCTDKAIEILNAANDLDPYNLYSTCYLPGSQKRNFIRRQLHRLAKVPLLGRATNATLPPCETIDDDMQTYLRRADVRTALHIPSLLSAWSDCSDDVGNQYTTTHYDVSPETLKIAAKARVLFYNGDVDTVCNNILNQQFVENLNLTVQGSERVNLKWTYQDEDPNVAGFYIQYHGNVEYITIRGSGHFVPEDKPREALQMIYNFIHQLPFSTAVPANRLS